ncbi:MAG: poly-gamma-glutamate system protein [Ignavibacteria bacterium]|nr:poly-gamma-glutamate system protein [Ignavibacteria bacterium]
MRRYHILTPKHRALLLFTLLSIAVFAASKILPQREVPQDQRTNLSAATMMERAIASLREHSLSRGQLFDDALDPNHTGLIGVEYSEITTTLGSLEAKRTTTNPNMAAVLVQLLEESGVSGGDTIAVGCSGSFPALAIATLAASKALGVHPVVILSLGASSFGATRTDQTLLDLYEVLRKRGDFDIPAAAVSLGGAGDVGSDFEPEVRKKLIDKIRQSGVPFLYQDDLRQNVAERMGIYFGPSSKRRIAAFVNIGGSYADMGTNPSVLTLEPGVNKQMTIPAHEEEHGVVFAMAKRHIPVVHLLHIKGLALKYGLPWDPMPLPVVSGGGVSYVRSGFDGVTWTLTVAYFSLIMLIFVHYRKAFF